MKGEEGENVTQKGEDGRREATERRVFSVMHLLGLSS